jgi:ubiquinone/menaquinone biosynthesis C-methylase UbiE
MIEGEYYYNLKKLNFGAGKDIRQGYDNIDFKHFDFNKMPYPIAASTYDYILVRDVLEHLNEPNKVLEELHRIAKPYGVIEIIVPYYNSAGAFGSMEHKHYFNRSCFESLDIHTNYNKCVTKQFKVRYIYLKPTRLGRLIFIPAIRELASFIIGVVYNSIEVKLEVLK